MNLVQGNADFAKSDNKREDMERSRVALEGHRSYLQFIGDSAGVAAVDQDIAATQEKIDKLDKQGGNS